MTPIRGGQCLDQAATLEPRQRGVQGARSQRPPRLPLHLRHDRVPVARTLAEGDEDVDRCADSAQHTFSGSQRGTVTASLPPGLSARTNSSIAASSCGTCSRISKAIAKIEGAVVVRQVERVTLDGLGLRRRGSLGKKCDQGFTPSRPCTAPVHDYRRQRRRSGAGGLIPTGCGWSNAFAGKAYYLFADYADNWMHALEVQPDREGVVSA